MAEGGEEASLLSAICLIQGVKWQVDLTQKHITLKQSKPLSGKKVKSKVPGNIYLSRVVCAKKVCTDKAKSEPVVVQDELEIHYCVVRKEYRWELQSIKLSFCPSETLCSTDDDVEYSQQWMDRINEIISAPEHNRPRKLAVFINPMGGKHKGVSIYKNQVAPIFELAGVNTQVTVSEYAGHLMEVVKNLDISDLDCLVAVGGDGTFREVADGVYRISSQEDGGEITDPNHHVRPPSVRLSLIPTGSGQGLSVLFTGTKDPATAALHIVTGQVQRPMDVMTCYSDSKFLGYSSLVLGTGVFCTLSKKAENNKWLGPAKYVYGLVGMLANWQTEKVQFDYLPLDAQNKDDTSTDANPSSAMPEKEWVSETIETRGLMCWNFDVERFHGDLRKLRDAPPQISILMVNPNCPRMHIVKWMQRGATKNVDWSDLDVKVIRCQGFRYRWNLDNRDQAPFYFNFDGDPCELPESQIEVRLNPGSMPVYGGGAMEE